MLLRYIKTYKFVILISFLPLLFLFFQWLFLYSEVDFSTFLFTYFNKCVDYAEYILPLKYIAAWLHGEGSYEYAKLAFNPLRIYNIFPSLPPFLLIYMGFSAAITTIIISTISLIISNIILDKLFNLIHPSHILIRLFFIGIFILLTMNIFYRSYVNQFGFISCLLAIYFAFKYAFCQNAKYLKYISIIVFLSFFSYAFSVLFIFPLFLLLGVYVFFFYREDFIKWLLFFLIIVLGASAFFIVDYWFKHSMPAFYLTNNRINSLPSIFPLIYPRYFFPYIFIMIILSLVVSVRKTKFGLIFILLPIALLIGHFHTIITFKSLQENTHFKEIHIILVLLFTYLFLFVYKNKALIFKAIYLILLLFLIYLKIEFFIGKIKDIEICNGNDIKYNNLFFKNENRYSAYKPIISDYKLASVLQFTQDINPQFVLGSSYMFQTSIQERSEFIILSYLSSKNALNRDSFYYFIHNYDVLYTKQLLNSYMLYKKTRLCNCKFLYNPVVCDLKKDSIDDVINTLFADTIQKMNFFISKNKTLYRYYFNLYDISLKNPELLLRKNNIHYALINKNVLSWWKSETNCNTVDTIYNHCIVRFSF